MSRLHHVAIGAREVEAVARFYRDLLALPEVARRHTDSGELRAVWLDADGTLIMIEKTSEPARWVSGVGAGPFLLAFAVSPEQRQALEQALQGAGFPIEERSEYTSYCRDPEGNRVAVSHYPERRNG